MARMQQKKLDQGWVACRATEVELTGEELSTPAHFPIKGSSEGWIEAVVPGTVLTTLLKNEKIPDPFYGLNNEEVPDIADVGPDYYTFWFCNQFDLPTLVENGKAWLLFRAINYQAEVFVNGHKEVLSKGMFLRHRLDITNWLNKDGNNYLAVKVHPPDHPGHIPPEGGQGGDHDIAKDVAAQYVQGWDWICAIRDRNTGIWDEVSVSNTGSVRISDPHLVATFDEGYTNATLFSSMELISTKPLPTNVTVMVNVSIDMEEDGICLIEHLATQEIVLNADATILYPFPPLHFVKPKLWWPNGMGDQPLYKVEITVTVDGEGESDTWSHLFGFRHITSYIDSSTNGRKFEVNGEPLFIRGGNWIVSDGLLRLSEDRYNTDVGFHADMNLNMIRVWGGALAERPEFYNACDKRGILVWQEFWITGDCNGRGVEPSDPQWPLDHDLFLKCAWDTVKLLRNHASLALWVGGNEQQPADDINDALTLGLALHSRNGNPSLCLDGTRAYIKGSLWEGFAAGNGLFRDGPYGIQVPERFFQENYYPYAFNPEIGNVGVPVAATIRATMPPEAWDPPQILDGEIANPTWFYHKFIPYSDEQNLVPGQIESYGVPEGLDDFCEKAQLVNYVQYRALIEGWNSWMWTHYTGMLIWKTQNPWPGLRGQMYDHLLDQTGAFFGIRCAAEPIHVQLNLLTYSIEAINTRKDHLSGFSVKATMYDIEGAIEYTNTIEHLTLPAYMTVSVGKVPLFESPNTQPVYFVLLKLLNSSGALVSRNFYWVHPTPGSYALLSGAFREQKVHIKTTTQIRLTGRLSYSISIYVENPSKERGDQQKDAGVGDVRDGVAFGLQFSVRNVNSKAQDNRILPVTYSHNWFSLVPGEALTVEVLFVLPDTKAHPKLLLRGWNVSEISIAL